MLGIGAQWRVQGSLNPSTVPEEQMQSGNVLQCRVAACQKDFRQYCLKKKKKEKKGEHVRADPVFHRFFCIVSTFTG